MPRLFVMPEVAAGAGEAVLAQWGVAEGEAFATGETIATVETDKAVVDIEADTDGVLVRQMVTDGTRVEVGSPIALLGDPGEAVTDVDAALSALGVGAAAKRSGTATGPEPDASADDARSPAPPLHSAPSAMRRIFISPLARRLAVTAGLQPEQIHGTGPHGRIRRRDVDAALAARATRGRAAPGAPVVSAPLAPPRATASAPQLTATEPPSAPRATPAEASAHVDIPVSRVRSAIARRLTESISQVPHFHVSGTARVDRLLDLRSELNGAASPPVSVNDLIVKAVAAALLEVPEMNATWGGETICRYTSADVAVAVSTPDGLVTPVLRGVDRMTVSEVARRSHDLAARAREGTLRQHELEGGSFTVSNLGMYGTEQFSGIINPPHAGLLAVGAARREPVVNDSGGLGVAQVMHVTLSADHRAVDGVVAAQWIGALVRLLEHPARILA
jgi:pyruvate dehydrogenase E2 component (dihydrolipoamide acetyltransferase)